MNRAWVLAWYVLALFATSACAGSRWRGNDPSYSAGAPERSSGGFTAPRIQRERFSYVPRPYPAAKVNASRVEVVFSDRRPDVRQVSMLTVPALALPRTGESLEVSVPSGFEAEVERRLVPYVTGRGPVLTLVIDVRQLKASRSGDTRKIEVELAVMIAVANRPLLSGGGQAYKELTGPYHDNAELEALHLAPCLDALDYVLASEVNIATINRSLPTPVAPARPAAL